MVECLETNEHLNTYFDIQAIYSISEDFRCLQKSSKILWLIIAVKPAKCDGLDHSCEWLGQWHPVTSCDQEATRWLPRLRVTPQLEWSRKECRNVWRHVIPDLWTQQILYIYIYVWHMYWVSLKSEKTIHCDFSSSNLSRNFDHQKNNIRSPFGQFLGWTSNQPWISVVIPLGAFRGTESWGITDWWLSRYVALSWSEVVRDSYAP